MKICYTLGSEWKLVRCIFKVFSFNLLFSLITDWWIAAHSLSSFMQMSETQHIKNCSSWFIHIVGQTLKPWEFYSSLNLYGLFDPDESNLVHIIPVRQLLYYKEDSHLTPLTIQVLVMLKHCKLMHIISCTVTIPKRIEATQKKIVSNTESS